MSETKPGYWTSGTYVLKTGRFHHDGREYRTGDTVTLDRANAERLGRADCIARPDSPEGRKLSAQTPEEVRQIRIEELEEELADLRAQQANEDAL